MLPFRLLRNRDRSAAYIMMLFTASAMFANFLFLSLLMQNILGYSALSTGLRFLPWSVTMIIFAMVISRLIQRVDPGKLSAAGGLIAGIGMFGLSPVPLQHGCDRARRLGRLLDPHLPVDRRSPRSAWPCCSSRPR